MRERLVPLPSGRKLQVVEDGDPQGVAVFALHGNPGSRLLYPKHVSDALANGIRLVGYDRPGYGGSTPCPGRSVGDAAADVAAIADSLGIDRFAVWGHSSGGPPALACAALLPDRVVGAASLAAHAPYPAGGLDWLAGQGEFNVTDFRLMLSDRAAWEQKVAHDRAEMLALTPDTLLSALSSLLTPVDRAALTPELREFFVREILEAFRNGPEGTRDDSLSEAIDWGFDLASIEVPVQLWHGRHDRFAPFAHGQWLASRLPRADTHLLDDEGHITLYARRIPDVHRWLVARF